MNWAKIAAEDIVSDDALDEADADKTSTSDWLKWALAAGVLGAGGFAAWKYRPEIREALGKINLFNNKTPSNRLAETISGGTTSSPALIGGAVGAIPTLPLSTTISGSRLLGGVNAEHRTIGGIGQTESNSGISSGGGRNTTEEIGEVANKIYGELESAGVGGKGLRSLHQAGLASPESGLARLRVWDPAAPQDWNTLKGRQLTQDVGVGANRRAALQETSDIIKRLGTLGKAVSGNVSYAVPGEAAPRAARLVDVPEEHLPHLGGHERSAWQAHRQLAREAGVAPDKVLNFAPAQLGAALDRSRIIKAPINWEHTGGRALIGAGVGLGVGAGIDAMAGQ